MKKILRYLLCIMAAMLFISMRVDVSAAKHLKKGKIFYDSQYKYKVTKVGTDDIIGEVQLMGFNPDYYKKRVPIIYKNDSTSLNRFTLNNVKTIYNVTGEEFNISSIMNGAFKNKKKMSAIEIQGKWDWLDYKYSYITNKIPKNCFYGCSNLTDVTLKTDLEKSLIIDEKAFYGCKRIQRLYISSKKVIIKKDAFKGVEDVYVSFASSNSSTGTYIKKLAKAVKKAGAKKVRYTFNYREYTLK